LSQTRRKVLANCLSKEITSGFVAFQILGNEIVMASTPKSRLAVWALTSVDLTGIMLDSLASQVGLSCFVGWLHIVAITRIETKSWCAMSRLEQAKKRVSPCHFVLEKRHCAEPA
jgi:hypothetical protein